MGCTCIDNSNDGSNIKPDGCNRFLNPFSKCMPARWRLTDGTFTKDMCSVRVGPAHNMAMFPTSHGVLTYNPLDNNLEAIVCNTLRDRNERQLWSNRWGHVGVLGGGEH